MAELKTKATKASVDAFLQTVGEDRRADCRTLVRIMSDATGEKATMWGPSIVGFGKHRYKYDTGRELDWFVTGFSPRKRDLTLYIMPGIKNYPELLEKLGPYKTGVSCLYIKRLADVDVAVLKKLVTTAVKDFRNIHR